jgi:hypothetical protein
MPGPTGRSGAGHGGEPVLGHTDRRPRGRRDRPGAGPVEGAIFGVISKSGAGYATVLAALRLARLSSSDPVALSALLAALGQVEAASRSGCSSCGVSLTTGQGPVAGGAGTPAYSRRGPT